MTDSNLPPKQAKRFTRAPKPELVKDIHALTLRNAPIFPEQGTDMLQYMCLYCSKTVFRVQIRETCDNGQTLVCPCGVDALIDVNKAMALVYHHVHHEYFGKGISLAELAKEDEELASYIAAQSESGETGAKSQDISS